MTTEFHQINAEIGDAFETYWAEYVSERGDTEIRAKRHDVHLEREQKFALATLAGVLAMEERFPGAITTLFDIDETIASATYDLESTVVRPAFPIVVRALGELLDGKLETGILTTRGQQHLYDELHSPTYSTVLEQTLNPSFVISSYDGASAQALIEAGIADLPVAQKMLEPLVDYPSVETVKHEGCDSNFRKPLILSGLLQNNVDRAFVVIDDHPWVKAIHADLPRLEGTHICADALFRVPLG